MRFLKAFAVVGTIVSGALGLSGAVSASPLVSTAMPAAELDSGVVDRAQMYVERRVYGPRRVVRTHPAYRPAYRPYRRVVIASPTDRPVYRPYGRVVRAYPVYGPVRRGWAPRIVCRTYYTVVRTPYGLGRRPVRICAR